MSFIDVAFSESVISDLGFVVVLLAAILSTLWLAAKMLGSGNLPSQIKHGHELARDIQRREQQFHDEWWMSYHLVRTELVRCGANEDLIPSFEVIRDEFWSGSELQVFRAMRTVRTGEGAGEVELFDMRFTVQGGSIHFRLSQAGGER